MHDKLTLKQFVTTVLPFGIVFIGVFSILPFPSSSIPILEHLQITVVWWTILFFYFYLFFSSNRFFSNQKDLYVLKAYLIWVVICMVRGAFVTEMYWDWKVLINNSLGLLLPVVAYSATNKVVVQSILSTYIKYGLPLFLVLMVLIRTDAYGFYLMPVSFLLLFLPALSKNQRLILFFFTAIVFGADFGARSNIIKFSFPLFMLVIYYFEDKLSRSLLNKVRLAMIIAPIILLSLGAADIFNIFKISEYIGEIRAIGLDDDGARNQVDVTADTRTFLYVEVIESAINNDYWIFGRTPARGNDSEFFGPLYFEITGREERWDNEIGVANVFTWTGIVGVILYMLIFYQASYLAVNRSRNIYAKMLGMFVAFRWVYSWIEDTNVVSLNYFMLCIMIGLCFSSSFRSMTNHEVTIWARGIFDYRYLYFEKFRKLESEEHEEYEEYEEQE